MSVSATVAGDLTTCSICLDTFDDPRSLPCLHAFCLKCIRDHCRVRATRNKVPSCPECREEFQIPVGGVSSLKHNFFIQSLVDARKPLSEKKSGVHCEVCLEEKGKQGASNVPPATKYCVDCEQKLCDQCSAPHRRMRGGAHEVKVLGPELEQELLQLRRCYCDKHEDKRVELYCFTCQENICLTCSAVKHSDNKRAEITELAPDFKSQINSDNRQIYSHISKIRRRAKQTRVKKETFVADVDKHSVEIKAAGERAKQMIDRQVAERLKEVETVKVEHVKKAAEVEDRLQLELVAAESFHRYSCELVDKGRPSYITRSAAELHVRAEELLHNEVISASYSPPHVTFAPADVTALTNTDFIGAVRVYPESQVIHTFPEGKAIWGIASLDDKVYLLRNQLTDTIEVCNSNTFSFQRFISVKNATSLNNLIACAHYRVLYISDSIAKCVHRVDIQSDKVTNWSVSDAPAGLSINVANNVLVTCDEVRQIKEFTTHGKLMRTVTLPDHVVHPLHATELTNGQFVVSHGNAGDPVHRVCSVSSDGRLIVHSHGGQVGSNTDQYDVPVRLAIDDNGFVFVLDLNNRRLTLLSPNLTYLHQVLSPDHFKWKSLRLCLDIHRRRLYVADNEYKDGKWTTTGRAVAFSV